MFELVYCSTARLNLKSADLSSILEKSRNFNKVEGITGCLLFHNNEFLQLLEGEKDKVQSLYSVIKKDKRHFDLLLLTEGNKPKRIFSKWSMAYHTLNDKDLEKIRFANNFISFSKFSERPTQAVDLF